jgi:hypothetical protein
MSDKQIYRIVFVNQNQVYEIYAKRVFQGELYGFVVLEDFVFGESSPIVVDPTEEKLKREFAGVKRSFIPMHEIVRIDQVEARGCAKILPINREAVETRKHPQPYSPEKT